MFGSIGIGEMVFIAGIALVVIGPEKFPDFAKVVLRTVRDLRGYMDEVKEEVSKELKPVQKQVQELSKYDAEDYIDSLTGTDEDPYSSESEDDYSYGESRDEGGEFGGNSTEDDEDASGYEQAEGEIPEAAQEEAAQEEETEVSEDLENFMGEDQDSAGKDSDLSGPERLDG